MHDDGFRPRRSVLYMPGANARALEKARTLDADGLILDLEDAVAPDAKSMAREQVVAAVAAGGYGHREVIVRINGLDTAWGNDDLEAAARVRPDAILVPKVSEPEQIRTVGRRLGELDPGGRVAIWAMMETPIGILDLGAIAAAKKDEPRFRAFVMGTNDLAKETGASLDQGRAAMTAWLSFAVLAASAHGLTIIDGVYNDFRDNEGFVAECAQGRLLGMHGKTLIHPGQIAEANRAFAPSAEEVVRARRIVAAFEAPENAGKGVVTLDGRMVELLHARVAARTLAVADAIAKRDGGEGCVSTDT
ncbi:MAG: CoA ester lyase [Rhizobiales bacterium]|nr:CoA ester lyase [Hyphomicrobiales bacterium]